MLYREIIAVCSEIHTKHINTLCGQSVEYFSLKRGGTYNNYWVLVVTLSTSMQHRSFQEASRHMGDQEGLSLPNTKTSSWHSPYIGPAVSNQLVPTILILS